MNEQSISTPESEAKITYFPTCEAELAVYREKKVFHRGEKLDLAKDKLALRTILTAQGIPVGDEDRIDVYNPSIPCKVRGQEYIVGRVEPSSKEAEHTSLAIIFRKDGEMWIPLEQPTFKLQDPRVTWIDGQMIFSGVEIEKKEDDRVEYRTVFYKGKDFSDLTRMAEGPWGMKGICLSKLQDGRIAVYTRPQGNKGGAGQIGFTIVDSLDEFIEHTTTIIDEAPLLDQRFPAGEWGGANQIIPLPEGDNLIVGHRAYRDADGNRHYYPWACTHDPYNGEVTNLGILTERSNFAQGPAKASDLQDVVYTSGIVKKDDKWMLTVGLSDTQAGVVEVDMQLSLDGIKK